MHRMGVTHAWLRPGVAAALLLLGPPARADDENSYRIEYRAPPECPDAATFARQVALRTERGHAAYGPVLARLMSIEIGSGYVGRLRFLDRNAHLVVRELTAPSCAELVEALVLVTALAIDAQTPEAAEPEPEVRLPQPYLLPAAAMPNAPPASLSPDPRPRRTTRSRVPGVLGVAAVVDDQSSPQLSWGVEASGGLLVLPPGIGWRLRFRCTQSGWVSVQGERARFELFALGTDLCPLTGTLGPVRAGVCGDLQIGVLQGAGEASARIQDAEVARRTWAAMGALGRLELRLGRNVAWELQVEALEALVRPHYRFENPDIDVYRPPVIGLSAGTGIALWID
jgi:hypothetical protein